MSDVILVPGQGFVHEPSEGESAVPGYEKMATLSWSWMISALSITTLAIGKLYRAIAEEIVTYPSKMTGDELRSLCTEMGLTLAGPDSQDYIAGSDPMGKA